MIRVANLADRFDKDAKQINFDLGGYFKNFRKIYKQIEETFLTGQPMNGGLKVSPDASLDSKDILIINLDPQEIRAFMISF